MSEWREETWAIRTQMRQTQAAEHSVPVYLTSSYTFDDAETMRAAFADEVSHYIYGRYTNPNVDEFVAKVCRLEGAESGHAAATGMAALFGTIGGLLQVGDHIVAGRAIFGTTHTLLTKWLPRFGIAHTLVDLAGGVDAFADAITAATKMMLVETPTNPGVEIVDLEALAALAHERGLVMVVDNTFATPALQKPIRHGADLVFHSATKFMEGQGRVLGGIVVGPERLIKEIRLFCRTTGPSLSAFDAWVISKGIETLFLRVERHSANALALAQRLEANPEVERVRYPFLPSHPGHGIAKRQMKAGGAMVAFAVKGGLERGRRFLDALDMCTLTPNLGDTRTIVTHPASTTHSKLTDEERAAVGISPGLVRVSVGLEAAEDIIGDIEQALAASR